MHRSRKKKECKFNANPQLLQFLRFLVTRSYHSDLQSLYGHGSLRSRVSGALFLELVGGDTNDCSISPVEVEIEEVRKDDLANQSILGQMKEMVMFTLRDLRLDCGYVGR